MGFPDGSDGKASAYNLGDQGLIPGSRRSHGEVNGNPLQYSCLQNPMDRGTWQATVHGVIHKNSPPVPFSCLPLLHSHPNSSESLVWKYAHSLGLLFSTQIQGYTLQNTINKEAKWKTISCADVYNTKKESLFWTQFLVLSLFSVKKVLSHKSF